DQAMLKRLVTGVELEDGKARFEQVTEHDDATRGNRWFHVTVRQGRKRVVRRLWASQGVTVSRLIRVGYGPVTPPSGRKARPARRAPPRGGARCARQPPDPRALRPRHAAQRRQGRPGARAERGRSARAGRPGWFTPLSGKGRGKTRAGAYCWRNHSSCGAHL